LGGRAHLAGVVSGPRPPSCPRLRAIVRDPAVFYPGRHSTDKHHGVRRPQILRVVLDASLRCVPHGQGGKASVITQGRPTISRSPGELGDWLAVTFLPFRSRASSQQFQSCGALVNNLHIRKPRTLHRYLEIIRLQVEPLFGMVQVRNLDRLRIKKLLRAKRGGYNRVQSATLKPLSEMS
jgi:hypothetical protein